MQAQKENHPKSGSAPAPLPKRRLGDRYDGYRLRNIDPIYQLVPIIMRTRTDAQVYYDDFVEIDALERFVNRMRAEGMPELRTIHVILAAMVRVISQKPRVNRFIAGKKLYARKHIRFAMAVKRAWNEDAESTEILPEFEPDDTLYEVVKKTEEAIGSIKNSESATSTDAIAKIFSYCPVFLKSFLVGAVRNLDKFGLMPKGIYQASPFHTSVFLTDVGSLGLPAVYHHLYELGTTSVFLAIGRKEYYPQANSAGEISAVKKLHLRYTIDERICDGYYFASAIKMMNRLLRNPESLLRKPEIVIREKVR